MVTQGKIGYGTTLSWGTPPVAVVELTRIGGVSLTVGKIDSTYLNSPNYYKEMLPGLIDPGDVAIEGWFRPDDPGQFAILTDCEGRTSRAFTIAFPTALSTTTWTGTAYITGFVAGDATPEGIIPFSATMSIVGKPTLNVTASAGMTAMTGIDNVGGGITIIPAIAFDTYAYTTTVADTVAFIQLTITAAAPQAIEVTVLGIVHILQTTLQSEALIIDVAGTVTPIYIKVKEALKSARNYILSVTRLP